jgi:hypothetical protein
MLFSQSDWDQIYTADFSWITNESAEEVPHFADGAFPPIADRTCRI